MVGPIHNKTVFMATMKDLSMIFKFPNLASTYLGKALSFKVMAILEVGSLIRTRLVVTVEPETKWLPVSDSVPKLMPKCKILGQYDLSNYFYSCLKIAVF